MSRASVEPPALSRELRLLWILDQVRRGNFNIGKGARLAGMKRLPFLAVMKDHGMAAIAYPLEDLANEINLLDMM